jgi:flavin reductase (DIM6/NTAB) family NADH-FMN oxidoreductase RutF
VPLIAGALAWFECERWRRYEGGDHSIFVGRPVLVGCGPGEDGLLFHRGRFHRTDRGGTQP